MDDKQPTTSETPRTDALSDALDCGAGCSKSEARLVEFARQLERELSDATRHASQLHAELAEARAHLTAILTSADSRAEYQAHLAAGK